MQSFLLCILVLSVIFVNGWTDAPNSITSVVATKTLSFRQATLFAAFFDLAGVLITSLLCPTVAHTVFTIVDFGNNSDAALTALQATLLSIVIWAILAWYFGIPTSESHALISGLTGAAIALHGNFSGVCAEAWVKVLAGLILSTACGALIGRYAARHLLLRGLSSSQVRKGQLLCSASISFFHGAQDGQKFLALLFLVRTLAQGQIAQVFVVSLPSAILCSAVMATGVLCGGQRIINTISQGMDGLTRRQGLAADFSGTACLFAASLLGFPVSTTHTKISAVFGAGQAASASPGKRCIAVRILLIWLATFPCCGFLSWALARLMLL